MNISCNNCGAEIPSENVNIDHMVAKCAACNAVFSFADQFPERDQPASNKPLDVPQPKGLEIESTGYELILRRRWLSLKTGCLTFIALLWNGFMIMWFNLIISQGEWDMAIFGSLHVAIGIFLAYTMLADYINTTVITISPHMVKITHGPLPWPGNKQIDAARLKQLYVKENIHRSKNSVSYTYELQGITTNNKHQKLLSGLQKSEVVRYIEQEIERYLGIKDQRVRNEY